MRKLTEYTSVFLIGLLLLPGCTGNDPAVSVIDFPEGNCSGKVSNAEGAPISGASVFLVPEGYSPLAGASAPTEIASTVSDEQGRYAFNVEKNGVYNLLAEGKNQYGMRTAIKVSTSSRMELTAQVLREPGSLTGVVQLHSADDHSSAVILLPGTNKYAVPSDKKGQFTFAALAEGSYKIRMMSTKSDYAVVDTTITIVAGEETLLPITVLQEKKQAHITQFAAVYDSLMMEVNLSWEVDDPALVDSFAVFCNREKNIMPILKTAAPVTTCKVDIIALPGDTFVYQVAAIGKDKWLSPPAVAAPVVKKSGIMMKTYPLPVDDAENIYYRLFMSEHLVNNGSRYSKVHWDSSLVKIDADLGVEKKFIFPTDVDWRGDPWLLCDATGNVYASMDSMGEMLLFKFDKDLNLLKRTRLPEGHYLSAVSPNGSILSYARVADRFIMDTINKTVTTVPVDSTYISIFDLEMNVLSETVIPGQFMIKESYVNGETVVATILVRKSLSEARNRDDSTAISMGWPRGGWNLHEVAIFDASFTKIRSVHPDLAGTKPCLPPFYNHNNEYFQLAPGNLFMTSAYTDELGVPSQIVLFTDLNNKVVARMPSEDLYTSDGFNIDYVLGRLYTQCSGSCDYNNNLLEFILPPKILNK